MLATKEYIQSKERSGRLGRFDYLQALVTEFQDTDKKDCKEQTLANLANFAYDPINYEHFKKLNILELFLDMLTEENEKFVEFGVSGLCNLCLDPENKEWLIKNDGIPAVIDCLSSTNEETVLSAITTLMYLVTPSSKAEITSEAVIECMEKFSQSSNKRLANLAGVFLQDYCDKG